MGPYKTEEIIAIYNQEGEVVCTECLGDTPWYDAIGTEDDIITKAAMEDKKEVLSCHMCKKKI